MVLILVLMPPFEVALHVMIAGESEVVSICIRENGCRFFRSVSLFMKGIVS